MKADIVSAALAAIAAGQAQVLNDAVGAAVDAAYAEQKAADGTTTTPSDQATIDSLTAQVAALQAQDAADVQAGKDALATLQGAFDTMSAAKMVEDGVIANLQSAKDQLAAVLASLSAIGVPPVVVPDPAP